MVESQRAALGDVTDSDVVGSAYCVRDYVVDERLGGDEGLAVARAALSGSRRPARPRLRPQPRRARPSVGSQLDGVVRPTGQRRTIPGTIRRRSSRSASTCSPAAVIRTSPPGRRCSNSMRRVPTCGRRQRNSASGSRNDVTRLRCDMAMLMLDDVFHRTWGDRASGGPAPDGGRGYWPTVMSTARAVRSDFAFWPGVLGPRTRVARPGIRRLLRQGPVRPPRSPCAGRRVARPRRGRSRRATENGSVRREPRRAAGRGGVRRCGTPGGPRQRVHPAGCGAPPRG